MKIFYTGADTYNAVQKDKDKSLGGFKSSTSIANDTLNNFFGDVSMYGLDEKLRETRALIIHNETNSALTNLYIWFDKLTNSIGKFELAAVLLTPDSNGEVYMESIDNIRATPYEATFVEADGITNKQLLINSMPADSYIGIWLRRSILSSDKDSLQPDTLYQKYLQDPNEQVKVEAGVNITLSWT